MAITIQSNSKWGVLVLFLLWNNYYLATTTTALSVPERMILSKSLSKANLQDTPLIPLSFDNNIVSEKERQTSAEVIQENSGKFGSICFVVRRPGWQFCREEGQALTKLSEESKEACEGFQFFGVVKETGIDDDGLMEFHDSYFPFSLYRDEQLKYYQSMGDRKIKIPWKRPLQLIKGIFFIRRAAKRIKQKKIGGNLVGEGLTKGGVLLFGPDGRQQYAYREESLKEMPIDDILAAIAAIKQSAAD